MIESLMPNHLPLCALECKANAAIAIFGIDARDMRTVFWARTIRCGLQTRKTKHKADHLFIHECAEYKSAVMNSGNQQMRGDNIRLTAGPDFTLKRFNRGHFFNGFQQTNIP